MVALGTSEGSVHLFNVEHHKLDLIKILPPTPGYGAVQILRFDHQGKTLATGHDTGNCEVSFLSDRFIFGILKLG